MNQRRAPVLLGFGCIAVFAIVSCGRQDAAWTDDDGLLRYVPADTPYLLATLEPVPEELVDRMGPWADSVLESYGAFLSALIAQAGTGGATQLSAEMQEQVRAVAEIVAELLTIEGRRDAGIDRDSLVALYGRGLLPVMRMSLSDGALFEATIARIEAAANRGLEVATLGAHSYRYFENDAIRVAIAVQDDQLIVTAAPAGLSDAHLMAVLDGELPDESLAGSGRLGEFAAEYGLRPFQVGFIDFDRLAATFLEPQDGPDAELLALVGYDPEAMLSATCRTEFRELANVAPLIVFGTTALDADEISTKAVIELRADIAAGLEPIAASVPGLGTISEGLFSFGLGFDVAAARDFASARLDALETDPFRCEQLLGIQEGVPAARQALSTPLPDLVYDIKGFVAILDDIRGMNLAADQLPTGLDLRVLLASANAPAIVEMGAAFDPMIAALDLQPNGTPVRVDVPPMVPMITEAYAALTQQAIAIAVGNDAEARLRALISAPAGEPLLASSDTDMRRYYALMDELASLPPEDAGLPPELQAALGDVMGSLAEGPFERSRAEARVTERGVEITTTIALGD